MTQSQTSVADPAAAAPLDPSVAQPPVGDGPGSAGSEDLALAGGHDPQYLPLFPLWTPEIERKIALSLEWIVGDMRGALLSGLPLVGKSHFLLYARKVIPPMLGGAVSAHLWSFLGYASGSKEDVLRSLMLQSGCRAVNARSPAVLLARLIDHLCGLAGTIGARRILLLVDELQELPVDMYPVLMSVTSALQTEGLLPCCISMGQAEMHDRVEEFHQQGKLQVIGRFFAQVSRFSALSVDDAIETLKNLELQGGFTARWFPHLHEIGWSLERLGPPLRASMDKLRSEKGLTQPMLLPFSQFRPTLKFMLRLLANNPECRTGLSEDNVYECLVRSGYPEVMHHYVQMETEQ